MPLRRTITSLDMRFPGWKRVILYRYDKSPENLSRGSCYVTAGGECCLFSRGCLAASGRDVLVVVEVGLVFEVGVDHDGVDFEGVAFDLGCVFG